MVVKRCPKCGTALSAQAVICPACDYIVDTSFLDDFDPLDFADDGDDAKTVPALKRPLLKTIDDEDDVPTAPHRSAAGERPYGAEALILGDVGDATASFHSMLSDQTSTHRLPGQAAVFEPAPVYVADGLLRMLEPSAVLALRDGADHTSLALSALERSVVALIDGNRPFARIAAKANMSASDLKIAIGMLSDRQLVVLKGHVRNATDSSAAEEELDILDAGELAEELDDERRVARALDPFGALPSDDAPAVMERPRSGAEAPNPTVVAPAQPHPVSMDGWQTPSPVTSPSMVFARAKPAPLPLLAAPLPVLTAAPLPVIAPALPVALGVAIADRAVPVAIGVLEDDELPSDEHVVFDPVLPVDLAPVHLAHVALAPVDLANRAPAKPADEESAFGSVRPGMALKPAMSLRPPPAPPSPTPTPTPTPTSTPSAAPRTSARVDARARVKAAQMLEHALADLRDGRKARALTYAKLAAGLDPENAQAQELLAGWRDVEHFPAEASTAHLSPHASAARMATAAPDQRLVSDAQHAEDAQDFAKAAELYRTAIALKPLEPELRNRLGILYALRLHDYTSGTNELMRACELAPDNLAYRSNLGKVFKLASGTPSDEAMLSGSDGEALREQAKGKRGLLAFLRGRRSRAT